MKTSKVQGYSGFWVMRFPDVTKLELGPFKRLKKLAI